jgi:hypothetical protein
MGIIFILWIIKKDDGKKIGDVKIVDVKKNTSITGKYVLNTTKAGYVKAVVYWCVQNFGIPSGNKKIPGVLIKYVKHSKLLGCYCSANKIIQVYLPGHENLLQLTNTILHEYDHFRTIRNNKDQMNYNKLLVEIGYDKHPLERSARVLSSTYDLICLKAMAEKGLLVKK